MCNTRCYRYYFLEFNKVTIRFTAPKCNLYFFGELSETISLRSSFGELFDMHWISPGKNFNSFRFFEGLKFSFVLTSLLNMNAFFEFCNQPYCFFLEFDSDFFRSIICSLFLNVSLCNCSIFSSLTLNRLIKLTSPIPNTGGNSIKSCWGSTKL